MMILLGVLQLWWQWLRRLILGRTKQRHGTRRREAARPPGRERKPAWVARRVIWFKALMPDAGCRQIADIFNRIHGARRGVTIGKTFVADLMRAHAREIAELRRQLRRRPPRPCRRNAVWALDLTGKQDQSGQTHMILGLIDHGTRLALMLRTVRRANSWTMLGYLCLAIGRWGKPAALRTDNAAIFTSRLFCGALARIGIHHQRSAVGCPWQNGRIERLFGTLKSKLDRWPVASAQELARSLALFAHWYSAIRPHPDDRRALRLAGSVRRCLWPSGGNGDARQKVDHFGGGASEEPARLSDDVASRTRIPAASCPAGCPLRSREAANRVIGHADGTPRSACADPKSDAHHAAGFPGIFCEGYQMFTPELIARDGSEIVLVANHYLGSDESRSLSIEFLRHRIEYGRKNIPNSDVIFTIFYDVRGQLFSEDLEEKIRTELSDIAAVRFKIK